MNDPSIILDRMRRPLRFAVRDGFAHIKSLAGIEQFMRAQVDELRRMGIKDNGLDEIESVFSGFDGLPADDKKERISKAEAVIEAVAKRLLGEYQAGAAGNNAVETGLPAPESGVQRNASFMLNLAAPVQFCKNVGPKRAEALKKLGIQTVFDALMYLPWRYEDRGNLKNISRISFGSYETVLGKVVSAEVVRSKRKGMEIFELTISDGTGFLIGSWFKQAFMKKNFKAGQKVILYGMVKSNPYRGGIAQMDNPEYEIIEENGPDDLIHTGRIVPIYRATVGLSVRQIRRMMKDILDSCGNAIPDPMPGYIIKKYSLMPFAEAVAEVHFPMHEKDISLLNRGMSPAHRRLCFDELFALELGLALKKRGLSVHKKGVSFRSPGNLEETLRKSLPFALTSAQERVIKEIKNDMAAERPMNRLLQGDVGSGKTVVAAIACLTAIESGFQAAIMAPTEILAEQHYRNIVNMTAPLGIRVCCLTGGLRKKEKESVLAEIEDGTARIVVGTHALIEEGVKFHRLGLVVIDEQHRFGVLQRSALTSKGYEPDVLVMTATPIPRTLALTVYGDLDVSVLDEMPAGRSPVITKLYFEPQRSEAYRLIEAELKKGRQAYVVYPLVEETEKSDLKAATEMAAHLAKDVFRTWKVGLLHGRMKSEEKEAVMAAFKSGDVNILVSTTVIEVGVDVPNATVMVIEHPERFGLAQLHQLRGRVGRGADQSYCLLMGPKMFSEESRARLMAFVRTTDGFRIAEEDLRLRGPGEFFGTRQSGLPDLRAANIIRDADLLERAREEAFDIVARDPELVSHPDLRGLIDRMWQGRLGLISVG